MDVFSDFSKRADWSVGKLSHRIYSRFPERTHKGIISAAHFLDRRRQRHGRSTLSSGAFGFMMNRIFTFLIRCKARTDRGDGSVN